MTNIPTKRQSWCKNPSGYEKHQHLLVKLVAYFEELGHKVEIPEDRDGWDLGRDLTVSGAVLDLKGIWLKAEGDDLVWDSPYYERKPHPATFDGSLTDWFVHAKGDDVSTWVMGPAMHTLGDKFDCNPYYKACNTMTVGEFAQITL